jgi:hypothetical protein
LGVGPPKTYATLPTGTLLKVSDDGKALLLIKKPKGTMIRVL